MQPSRNFDYDAAARALGLDPDWYDDEEQMREDVAARWGQANSQQRASFARDMAKNKPSAPIRMPTPGGFMNDHGDSQALGAYNYANMAHGMQGGHLQGMANMAMGAIAKENDRRVALSREQRRMQHEQELERMRQETEQMKINALISRLQQQQGGWSNPAEGLFFR